MNMQNKTSNPDYYSDYYQENKDKIKARVKEWRKNNPRTDKRSKEAQRNSALKYRFGITSEIYEQMLTDQNGVCAICLKPPEGKRLDVDHEHSTGKIRGLLHGDCNRALGLFKENSDTMRRAAVYIEKQHDDT